MKPNVPTLGVTLVSHPRPDGSEYYRLQKTQGCPFATIALAAEAAKDNPMRVITLPEYYEAIYGGVIPPHMRAQDKRHIYKRLRGFIRRAKSLSIAREDLPMLFALTDKGGATIGFRLATKRERDLEAIRALAARDEHVGHTMLNRAEAQKGFAAV